MKKGNKLQIFAMVAKVAPAVFIAEYICTAIDGIALALLAFATERLFSAVIMLQGGERSVADAVMAVVFLLFIHIMSEVCSGMSNYLGEIYSNLSIQKLYKDVNCKLGQINAVAFENPEILNRINGAYAGVVYARSAVNTIMDIAVFYLPYFFIYGFYLYRLRPLLLLVLPSIFLPLLLVQFMKSKIYAGQEEQAVPLKRRAEAYASYLTDRAYAKETRTMGAVGYFRKRYVKVRMEISGIQRKTLRKSWRMDNSAKVISMIGYAGVIYLLIDSAVSGYIGISEFSAILLTMGNLIDMADEAIASRAGELSENLGKMRYYIDFLNLETRKEGTEKPGPLKRITLENVSFSYPDGDGKTILKDITLTLQDNETVALVGENGSGKTTLVKLLLGLYEPTKGVIIRNGIESEQLSFYELQKQHSAVFQNFSRYKMTLRENVGLGMKNREDSTIINALSRAGFTYCGEDMSKELDTMLSREFGGTELSGGQWQRIAIARGILRDCSLLVLDEPTSAIDPMREAEIYSTFLEAVNGRLAVIVTHRLGLARFCDRIAVMKEGRIVNVDSHENLLKNSAYYRNLWEAQARGYHDNQTG